MSDGKDDFIGERVIKINLGRNNGVWYIWDCKEFVMIGVLGYWLFSGRDELKGS